MIDITQSDVKNFTGNPVIVMTKMIPDKTPVRKKVPVIMITEMIPGIT
jgi:hypothetical protein